MPNTIFDNLTPPGWQLNLDLATEVEGTLGADHGGTGARSLTDHAVLLGSGAAAITPTAVGTTGQVLVGATGADPAWSSILTLATGASVFNDAAADIDFHFEGKTNPNLLFLDAGQDRVGIGTAAPGYLFDIDRGADVTGATMRIRGSSPTAIYTAWSTVGTGVAFSFFNLNLQNNTTTTTIQNIGIYGSYNQGGTPTLNYTYIGEAWDHAGWKFARRGRTGLGILSSTSPTYKLELRNSADIEPVVFTGSGLNNATAGGTYTGTAITTQTYTVVIDATGTPDTFKWKRNSEAYTTGVAITGAAETLTDGITVTFATTTGHTVNDQWVISVYAQAPLAVRTADNTIHLSMDALGGLSVDGGLTVNDAGADVNLRVESDTNQSILFVDGTGAGSVLVNSATVTAGYALKVVGNSWFNGVTQDDNTRRTITSGVATSVVASTHNCLLCVTGFVQVATVTATTGVVDYIGVNASVLPTSGDSIIVQNNSSGNLTFNDNAGAVEGGYAPLILSGRDQLVLENLNCVQFIYDGASANAWIEVGGRV